MEHWKLEQDSFWVRGMTGRPVAQEVHNLVSGCEDMLKLPQRIVAPAYYMPGGLYRDAKGHVLRYVRTPTGPGNWRFADRQYPFEWAERPLTRMPEGE